MENRRPPRANPSSRKPFSDRGRGANPYGGGRDGGQGPHKHRRPKENDGRQEDRGPSTRDGGRRGSPGRGAFSRGEDTRRVRYDGNRRGPDDRYQQRGSRTLKPKVETIKITSDAQVTDGRFRGRTLLNSDSPKSVATTRKLREIAFKILARRIKAARILDLGSGSGTIGIEAISRGAMLATFVERSARMCTFIRKNLAEMGVKNGHAEVVEMEILPFLKRSSRRKRHWDIVYFDLPDNDEHASILEQLSRGRSIREGGVLLIEHESKTSYPEVISTLKRRKTIDQGEKVLSIYERI